MSNPPVIAEPFYEFDITFQDDATAQVYMIGDADADNAGDTSAIATVIYNAIKANSNVTMVTQNLWGEDTLSSFSGNAVPVPPPEITYNPHH